MYKRQKKIIHQREYTVVNEHIKRCSLSLVKMELKQWAITTNLSDQIRSDHSVVSYSVTLWIAARQASLSITNSRSLLKLMSIQSVMPSNHLILCCPFLLPPTIFSRIRVFSNESVLRLRWPKYWNFSFNISPSNEYSGLISFRMDRFDLLAVQGTLKSLLQHHSSKASILRHSAFFMIQLSHHTWWLENHIFDYMDLCQQSAVFAF